MLPIPMLLALAVQDVPLTYGEATTLPPGAVGERALAGVAHRPVATVERERAAGPIPPGSARLYLYERPDRVAGGCVRRRWTVDFSARDPARMDDATVTQRFAGEEVGLIDRGSCAGATFVGSNGPDRAHVLALLSALERWRARPGGAALRCLGDEGRAAICASPAATRDALARAVPWHAPQVRTLWARVDGRLGYTITFDALPPTTIAIEGRVPAPF